MRDDCEVFMLHFITFSREIQITITMWLLSWAGVEAGGLLSSACWSIKEAERTGVSRVAWRTLRLRPRECCRPDCPWGWYWRWRWWWSHYQHVRDTTLMTKKKSTRWRDNFGLLSTAWGGNVVLLVLTCTKRWLLLANLKNIKSVF